MPAGYWCRERPITLRVTASQRSLRPQYTHARTHRSRSQQGTPHSQAVRVPWSGLGTFRAHTALPRQRYTHNPVDKAAQSPCRHCRLWQSPTQVPNNSHRQQGRVMHCQPGSRAPSQRTSPASSSQLECKNRHGITDQGNRDQSCLIRHLEQESATVSPTSSATPPSSARYQGSSSRVDTAQSTGRSISQ